MGDITPVEVTAKLYGWDAGESEVELTIPESSDLGSRLAAASPAERALLFARLRRHLVSEVIDAFAQLEPPRRPATSALGGSLGG